ncbi:MAG: phosphotransferase [Bacteroidales bacterium]|nr:phosphotransferase [Bacteroidales bacterium]MBQ9195312.1 phosphotransferase [Bacteroidales bacterium]
MTQQEQILKPLFESYTGQQLQEITEMPASGSNRRYFRLRGGNLSIIGVIGANLQENHSFITIAKHFKEKGLKVPAVFAVNEDESAYIQEDLGDQVLYGMVSQGRESGLYSSVETQLLKKAIEQLPRLQFVGAQGLDWKCCYPQETFDARMVDFDLNYFKYCFLKATGLEFNEVLLQDDFEKFKKDLLQEEDNTFMYRDFQARNVMVRDGEPWFIDFQGGRRGPIYYDVASFIWQARSRFPEDLKQELIKTYLRSLQSYKKVDESHFMERLRLFVLFRTLQVLGAYGFRGYFEKKPHFLASVPYALSNLRSLLQTPFTVYPYMNGLLEKMASMPELNEIAQDHRLSVHIYSFAYKKGIPADTTGNGGGYVFDCRSVNNPGKYEYYRQFNGTDPEVIKFLEDDGEVTTFLESVYNLVDAHAKRFIERKFTNLQVCFGCTGGQHRSVYCAEHLAHHLARKFDVKVTITHRELNIEKML